MLGRSRGFLCAGRQFFQDGAAELLQFAEAGEVILKFLVQKLGVLNVELVAKNDVAKLNGVWQKSVFF